MDVDIDLVLAPVDGSDRSESAAEYAIAIADRYDADIHLLYVLDQKVARGLEVGDVAAKSIAKQQGALTDRVREQLPEGVALSTSSVPGFSQTRLSQTPGNVILDGAEELDADFLVVPRKQPSEEPDEMLDKAALYVLEYASQPVLSV
ncbi:MAG: universal stress protein [Haloarculaceae archaeon]